MGIFHIYGVCRDVTLCVVLFCLESYAAQTYDLHFLHEFQIMPPVIDLDDHRFYRLVTLSNKLATPVLRRVIKQYCDVHGLTFEEVLNLYKHELFHYWHGATAGCCKCNGRRFTRVLLDHQWNALFTDISASLPTTHAHSGHDVKGCPEVVSARPGVDVDVCDISLASSILTNITGKVTTYPCCGSYNKNFHYYEFEHQWTSRVHSGPTIIVSRCEWL